MFNIYFCKAHSSVEYPVHGHGEQLYQYHTCSGLYIIDSCGMF